MQNTLISLVQNIHNTYNVGMYLVKQPWKSANGKTYYTILLRESYREGDRVQKRTIANLTHCSEQDIAAIELALKHKDDLVQLSSLGSVNVKLGRSIGAVSVIYQIACRIGIEKVLGTDFQGQLALWQVIARVIDRGSRLSAVRLAKTQVCEVVKFTQGFNENDLYGNLSWLAKNQDNIEETLFNFKNNTKNGNPKLFLYDVTSSYVEGEQNEFADWGYNRDGKKKKKQIVMGLLCDEEGSPISTELFKGNTQDLKTFSSQIKKAVERFGCKEVTFVGDRGMIKSDQIQALHAENFYYITATPKAQIEALLKQGVLEMSLFDETICEEAQDGIRYIYRKNPIRKAEMEASRQSKQQSVQRLVSTKNQYLAEHPRAKIKTALKTISNKIKKLKISSWLTVEEEGRTLKLTCNHETLKEESKLDGCYVIRTDLPREAADKNVIHDRYKDLALVEQAFRSCKTAHLELRPVYVRSKESTMGHALVIMLAYMVLRELQKSWKEIDMTTEECIEQLKTLCVVEVSTTQGGKCWKVPEPSDQVKILFKTLNVDLPTILPAHRIKVDTKKKLISERKKS
jgi:hypothetical protein